MMNNNLKMRTDALSIFLEGKYFHNYRCTVWDSTPHFLKREECYTALMNRGHTKGYLADNEYEGTDSLPLEESLAGYKKKTTSAGPVLEGSGSSGSSVPSTIMNESPSENERKMHEKTEVKARIAVAVTFFVAAIYFVWLMKKLHIWKRETS
ncbi:uncharacterized protein LOC132294262 isoform X3 [Cornus florida]|uniref:uncharacterized protein LOC132294262 isoform X3 n=1 Tax=Cornus florida TaxID=4283 RepID=UPI0028A23A58|nr:uncharacterized protein LOC132294262 isoform X3 [Cornus florida]